MAKNKSSSPVSVAIIMRTKDRPVLLKRAIASVCNQVFSDWQLVIVNDGGAKEPVDALVASCTESQKSKIVVIHNPKSAGMEAASNIGIRGSDSRYVIIHDDDDSWHSDFLKEAVAYLEDPTLPEGFGGVVCYSTRIVEKVEGERVTEQYREEFNSYLNEIFFWRMCAHNLFPPISFLYKREAYAQIGGEYGGLYNESLPVLGDWEFNLRFMRHYDIGLIKKHLAFYHHRTKDKDSQYSNSVIGGMDRHLFYNAHIRNTLLREDLKTGEMGLGVLVNLARDLHDSNHLVWLTKTEMDMWAKKRTNITEPSFWSSLYSKLTGKRIKPPHMRYD